MLIESRGVVNTAAADGGALTAPMGRADLMNHRTVEANRPASTS